MVIVESQREQKQDNQQYSSQDAPDRGMISHVPVSIRP